MLTVQILSKLIVQISTEDLSWMTNTNSMAKKVQQCLDFLSAKECASPSNYPHNLIQGLHQEHPDQLHHCDGNEPPSLLTTDLSKRLCRKRSGSLAPLFYVCRIYSPPGVSTKPPALWLALPTFPMDCSSSFQPEKALQYQEQVRKSVQ